jgi:hypothetical protein
MLIFLAIQEKNGNSFGMEDGRGKMEEGEE